MTIGRYIACHVAIVSKNWKDLVNEPWFKDCSLFLTGGPATFSCPNLAKMEIWNKSRHLLFLCIKRWYSQTCALRRIDAKKTNELRSSPLFQQKPENGEFIRVYMVRKSVDLQSEKPLRKLHYFRLLAQVLLRKERTSNNRSWINGRLFDTYVPKLGEDDPFWQAFFFDRAVQSPTRWSLNIFEHRFLLDNKNSSFKKLFLLPFGG